MEKIIFENASLQQIIDKIKNNPDIVYDIPLVDNEEFYRIICDVNIGYFRYHPTVELFSIAFSQDTESFRYLPSTVKGYADICKRVLAIDKTLIKYVRN